MDKEEAKAAKSFYTEQAKAAEALRNPQKNSEHLWKKSSTKLRPLFCGMWGFRGLWCWWCRRRFGYKPKGFSGETGIMAQLKSAITKQLPESIQVGIAGGMAAGGIMALVSYHWRCTQ